METSPLYRTKNKQAFEVLNDTIKFVYWDMNEASQALLITELKTRNPEKVEELQEMMDSGIPEMFVRKMLCEILFQSRIEQIINQDSQ